MLALDLRAALFIVLFVLVLSILLALWLDRRLWRKSSRAIVLTSFDSTETRLRSLLNDLTHELRMPLAVLLTHLEVQRSPTVPPETKQESLRLMHAEARRMSRMGSNILELGELETRGLTAKSPVDLRALATKVIAEMQPLAQERKIALSLDAAEGAFWVNGDSFLPIQGQVYVTTGNGEPAIVFPQTRIEPRANATNVFITDNVAWSNVGIAVNGKLYPASDWQANSNGIVTWRWELAPNAALQSSALNGDLIFYHSCQTGCVERTRLGLGKTNATVQASQWNPTKLGVVFANPKRDWRGRSGWDVEMTYSTLAEDSDSSRKSAHTRSRRSRPSFQDAARWGKQICR
ncbi:MAG: hypothetical protein DCC52_18090 [Chloroflexi bacterium]|nr:MAG: hypothetical protein DCC52_18090 [Chloroflexota bacterium]